MNDTKVVFVTAEVTLMVKIPSDWGDDEINDALNDLDYEFTSNDSDIEIKDYYISQFNW